MATGATVADWSETAGGPAAAAGVTNTFGAVVVVVEVAAAVAGDCCVPESASAGGVAGQGETAAAAAEDTEDRLHGCWAKHWTKSSACANGYSDWRTGPLALPLAVTPSCWARQVEATQDGAQWENSAAGKRTGGRAR